jgi:hypothetical protein
LTYLITFAGYGCHLHGSDSGSVDRNQNLPGTATIEPNSKRSELDRIQMDHPPYCLDRVRRDAVLEAIQEVCSNRRWTLLAAHVRTNHVHTVVDAEAPRS